MSKALKIVAPSLLAFLLLAFLSPKALGLTGQKAWILRIALWLIGLAAAAVVVWFFASKKKQEEKAAAAADEAPAGGEEIGVLLRDADRKLAAAQLAKGARIGALPAILAMGEASSTKTSIMLHSGLEPELLAGQVYQDGNVTTTRCANIWFSRRTVFVEASGKLLDDTAGRAYLIKHLLPRKLGAVMGGGGQAPRAVLVCVEIERLTGGAQALAATARNLRARLGEISQTFGIQLPVYVLFTKTDRLPFFADFVRNLTNEEATEALGVTLPIPGAVSGVWAEEQTTRLNGVFDQLFRSLCNARPEFLARENDQAKLPGAYEFPREFRKLRGPLVQFLVDLCRPSQLTVGPFLRGFYFSGVRPVIVQEAAPAAEARPAEQKGSESAREATAMFHVPVGGARPAASAPQARMTISRKVPQWLFLTHLFNDVLLADRAAMGASGASTKADTLRRTLLIAAAALCLILGACFTLSFFQNRGLESRIDNALAGTGAAPAAGVLAAVEPLRHLDSLRQSLLTLKDYHDNGAPLSYRWGLYAGDEMYPDVRRLYFARFKSLLFGQTQNGLVSFLSSLPATPGPDYDQTYSTLRAYLITTSNPDKSTHEFLTPVLLKTWSANQTVDPERLQLAKDQFDFYADELKLKNPFTGQNDVAAVDKARHYLKQFGDFERVYQAMKAGAPKTTVNYNRDIQGSKDYIVDSYEVAGPFTKDGFKFMNDAIRNPSRYVHGEAWVLGDQGATANTNPSELIKPLLARYESDYIKEWRNYLKSAALVRYKDIPDAAAKLNVLSSNQSPLLALFLLGAQNTAVDDPEISRVLQPMQYVVPPGSALYIVPQNQDYVNALSKLQVSVDTLAKSPPNDPNATSQTMGDANAALLTTKQLASKFNIDQEWQFHKIAQRVLEDPITTVQDLVRGAVPDELNAGGKALCGQFKAVLAKYPFNPAGKQDASVAEFNGILHPPDGALWKFYDASLKKFLAKQPNGQYAPVAGSAVTLTPQFVAFFNQAASFAEAVYAGGSADPHFTYTMKAVPTDTVQKSALEIDGQKLDFAGAPVSKQFTWQGQGTHAARGAFGSEGFNFTENEGTWAVFRLFGVADHRQTTPSGTELLDWNPRSGRDGKVITVNGKPVTVRFELDMGASPHVFESKFFSRLACVAEVAKP